MCDASNGCGSESMNVNFTDKLAKLGVKQFFSLIMIIIILTDLAILLNIPFLRQTIGFLFLTLLPGLLIIHVLKLNKLEFLEKFILAWGLSISFLMLFGLLLNNLSLGLGYELPLLTVPLLISFNLVAIALILIAYRMNKNVVFSLPNFNLSTAEKTFLIVPILFPALSIFGMHVMNTTDNNIILMFLLFLIPIYVIFVCFSNHKFPKRMYPVVIFLISLSLLLLLSLRSNHLIGDDVHEEFYFFLGTMNNLHWGVFGHSTLDACLSISLLPAIYKSILNVHTEYLYKILYSVLCSVFPVIIYIISKKYVEEGYAFLASIYFMSNATFLGTELNARASIAMLFFAFAMMTLFNDRIEPLRKRFLFIIFMASCMVSHYSTTYIFFFIMIGTFIGIEALSRKYTFKKVISLTLVVLFFAMIFFWYSQVTETAFNHGIRFIEDTLSSLNELFLEESRSGSAQALLGKGAVLQENIAYGIHWILTWITFAFIGIGVVTLIIKRKEMLFPELNFKMPPDFLKDKFEIVYAIMTLVLSGLLVAILVLPHISAGYGLGRAYPMASTILSVFFVIGGIMLSKHFFFFTKRKPVLKEKQKSLIKNVSQQTFKKHFASESVNGGKSSEVRAYLIILLVLVPYFLCITGVTYQMFGYPHQITLNSEGERYDKMYVYDQESYSVKWLKDYANEDQKIYTDCFGRKRLLSQGMISPSVIDIWSLILHGRADGYIYLRYQNIVTGKLIDSSYEKYNMTEYTNIFIEKNEIYDCGYSKVLRTI